MSVQVKHCAQGILEQSEHIRALRELKGAAGKSRLYSDAVRPLTSDERKELIAGGNRSFQWEGILVTDDFIPDFIQGNTFSGTVILGRMSGGPVQCEEGISFPCGIYNSVIADSEIGEGCLILRAGFVSNYVIRNGAVIREVQTLCAGSQCTFGNGLDIAVGNETGGREIMSFAELTIGLASDVATRRSDAQFLDEYRGAASRYREACTVSFGVVERGAVLRDTVRVQDTYIGPGTVIDGAQLVKNCTLLGSIEEPVCIGHGAIVTDSCLQWGCDVTSMAIVDRSVLTEHSHVERHGKVTSSVIGPNTGIAEGEVTSSLVGPFVGFHHQALLIAAIWPEGKGNVGYGANVGSNHTSKAPDQEIFCGEGVFFGLGTSVKFPADYTDAPYSIISTAVSTLPQRVEFPFSLINKPSMVFGDVSPHFNEIYPGWVLSGNIYAIRRNEKKFNTRNRARRSCFKYDVFRPDIVEKMISARDRLEGVAAVKEYYTQKDVHGLGKNVMQERSRKAGIDAYSFYIEYYILNALFRKMSALAENDDTSWIQEMYSRKDGDIEWEFARRFLVSEGLDARSQKENLERLCVMLKRIATNTRQSKEKDDGRGRMIITDYSDSHVHASDDPFVLETVRETEQAAVSVNALIARLGLE